MTLQEPGYPPSTTTWGFPRGMPHTRRTRGTRPAREVHPEAVKRPRAGQLIDPRELDQDHQEGHARDHGQREHDVRVADLRHAVGDAPYGKGCQARVDMKGEQRAACNPYCERGKYDFE